MSSLHQNSKWKDENEDKDKSEQEESKRVEYEKQNEVCNNTVTANACAHILNFTLISYFSCNTHKLLFRGHFTLSLRIA